MLENPSNPIMMPITHTLSRVHRISCCVDQQPHRQVDYIEVIKVSNNPPQTIFGLFTTSFVFPKNLYLKNVSDGSLLITLHTQLPVCLCSCLCSDYFFSIIPHVCLILCLWSLPLVSGSLCLWLYLLLYGYLLDDSTKKMILFYFNSPLMYIAEAFLISACSELFI